MAEPASVDALLDRLEKLLGRLAEAKEPIEDLVVAYEEGLRLLAEARTRLHDLGVASGQAP